MHRSELAGFIIDCKADDLGEAEKFWTEALGYESIKSSHPDDDGYVPLKTGIDDPHIELQQVTHPSGVHLDIAADDVEAEVSRLEKLGAKRVEKVKSWWIMEAPTGQRFCVVVADSSNFEKSANQWN